MTWDFGKQAQKGIFDLDQCETSITGWCSITCRLNKPERPGAVKDSDICQRHTDYIIFVTTLSTQT